MASDLHNPIPGALRPDRVAETVSKYRDGQERADGGYAATVTAFYDLITDFYEYGWGQSFHFAPAKDGASFEEAIAGHQHFLGEAIGLKPGMKVLGYRLRRRRRPATFHRKGVRRLAGRLHGHPSRKREL